MRTIRGSVLEEKTSTAAVLEACGDVDAVVLPLCCCECCSSVHAKTTKSVVASSTNIPKTSYCSSRLQNDEIETRARALVATPLSLYDSVNGLLRAR